MIEKRLGNEAKNFLDRLHLSKIDYNETFRDTPLQEWYTSKEYERTWWVEQNLGNALRLAILWKVGGTYFDLDIIFLKSLGIMVNATGKANATHKREPFGRFIGLEESHRLNNAALRFPPNDSFIEAVMQNFVYNFEGYVW